jgi:UDPglucose 6-dehydrogenase
MKIGIVGRGIVGGAVAEGMERLGHEVKVHDIKLGTTIDEVMQTEICFICVPTPQRPDGSCNTSIVESVIQDLISRDYLGIIAIKSTVTPGFTQGLIDKYSAGQLFEFSRSRFEAKLCFVPEFLREKSAFHDFTEGHDLLVVGAHNSESANRIIKAHGHYPQAIAQMSPTEAELAKYFSNVFNAMRVTFANGFYDVCKALGANYSKVKNAMVQRPTIENWYLDSNEKFRGFSGPCLPKDTAAFAALVDKLGLKAKIFRTIVEDNELYTPTVPEGMRMEGAKE